MTTKLAALTLTLDELGLPADTGTLPGRLKLQKAVYLAQAAGLPLGYRYNWYVRGPYSPDLTRDYFALPTAEHPAEGLKLTARAREAIQTIKPMMEVPEAANGLKHRADLWLEILASVHYLQSESRLSKERALEVINRQKPQLRKYAESAHRTLTEAGLL